MNLFRLIIISLFSFIASQTASAAACCASASAFGVGRLLNWEKLATGMRASYGTELAQSELWALVAVTRRASVFGVLPWIFPNSIGNAQLGARLQLLDVSWKNSFPGLGLVGAVLIPAGWMSANPHRAWGFTLGASIEKAWQQWFTQFNVATSWFAPGYYNGGDFPSWRGGNVQTALVGGIELPHDITLSTTGIYLYEHDSHVNHTSLEDTKHKSSLVLNLSWKFDPHWTLNSSFASELTFDATDDIKSHFSGQIGIRYGYF